MTSAFEGGVLAQTVGVALEHNIEPESLLAVVQVESDGKSLEIDNKTPCLLFERHIFYRELVKVKGPAQAAVQMGLANTSWQPKTQYKDQRTSQMRLDLFARASKLSQICAIRSCSWGVGQTMGFLAEELKFRDANMMFSYMVAGGVPAQVECMVREIENKKLTSKLNNHQWAAFAKVYNGPGYAQNNYDTKMAEAWAYWKKRGIPLVPSTPVRAPISVQPSGPVTPPKVITTTKTSVTAGGAVVVGTTTAVFWQQLDYRWLGLGGFVLVLAIITGIILWQRRQAAQFPQQGTLAGVKE
jgi:hypothetical protein